MSERREIFTFRIGEAFDDLWPAFFIDSRDYVNLESVRADVMAATRALDDARIIAECETSYPGPGTSAPTLPTWPQWRDRYLVGGEPIGVSPRPEKVIVPPGWSAMNGWFDQTHSRLCEDLLDAGKAVSETARVTYDPGPQRIGASSVDWSKERYRVTVSVSVWFGSRDEAAAQQALGTVARVLADAGWSVGEPVEEPRTILLRATRAGHTASALWRRGAGVLELLANSAIVGAGDFGTAGPSSPAAE
jgi:hypothetical protein